MDASTFRSRFAKAKSETPFVIYDSEFLRSAGVRSEDAEFLADIGLPCDFGVFSQFSVLDANTIATWRDAGFPLKLFPIGSNGAIAFYGIELNSGRIIEVSADWRRERLVNSNLVRLAETLCLFAEHLEDVPAFSERMAKIDAEASQTGCYWPDLVADFQALDGP